jgi:predicted amidohydrolase
MGRVAVVQLRASERKEENLAAARGFVREARGRGADLVAFPEFLMAYSPASQPLAELAEIAESVEGPFVAALREEARKHRIDVIATIYERCAAAPQVYDTALLIDAAGETRALYRKLHLYDALGFRESEKLRAGDEIARPVASSLGSTGLMICYDVRFPELARLLASAGAEILVCPSAWVQGEHKLEHWRAMVTARALENGCYVVAPDQTGNLYVGHSLVVDPFGRRLLEMGEEEGLEVTELDLGALREVREKLPLLRHRRPDVYRRYGG